MAMTSAPQLPAELWLHVFSSYSQWFSFLPWRDKLSMRSTCRYFRQLLDRSRPLWDGFCVALRHFSRYNRSFWRSLAQRHVGRAVVRSGKRKHLVQLGAWLPTLQALRLDGWTEGGVDLKRFQQLEHLSVTSCSAPLRDLDFLSRMRGHLTRLSLCNVQLTSPSHLVAAVSQLTRLTSLLLHHDGSLRVPTLRGLLTHLGQLTHLSWTMITYRTLPQDFFSPGHLPGKHVGGAGVGSG